MTPPVAPPIPGMNVTPGTVAPAQHVPSDFTRIIGAANAAPASPRATPAPSPPPTPAPAIPSAAMPRKIIGVIVALASLAVVGLSLVLHFLFRR